MANALYDPGRDAFARGNIDWINDDIRVMIVHTASGSGYTFDASHQYLSSVTSTAEIARATSSLANKTTDGAGVVDCDDYTLNSVTGTSADAVIMYLEQGASSDGDRDLIAYYDTGTNFPLTPNGGDLTFTPSNGALKLFKL